ncbi:hypothetical protein PV08_03517 [Exophiala spinifera]|uniref:Clr5 domain-containing protein n=1 Tax=Exophiala spinifera TaxID=91928 RepID=A0A0D2BJX7_9EURO|nr:uncharacterized protein PV08_03517 [Exophiala spinifera]KIW19223.1 hypothetical protein PV08_03517 [Exophiala spinifera]
MAGTLPQSEAAGLMVLEGPSPEEWALIKGVFIELYVHQERKLSEVRRLLAEQWLANTMPREKAYKRRIAQWRAFKNYKAADKKAISDTVQQVQESSNSPVRLYGRPVKWDRIKRFNRTPGPSRKRRSALPFEAKLDLQLRPDVLSPALESDERILFLTQSYLTWNVSRWKPLGFHGHTKGHVNAPDGLPAAFNKCFYDAIPLLLTKRTSEAFEKINFACSLALQCLQDCPYWVFLRLLRLYAYPLWGRFADVRSHIIRYLRLLASRTLPVSHPLNNLLDMWIEAGMEPDKARLAALLRLTSDLIGPSSPLEAEEWAWVQDEICSLHYQLGGFNDALRIADRLAVDTQIPLGVRICSLQMVARQYLHQANIEKAESILLDTLQLCDEAPDDFGADCFVPQSYSDLGYASFMKGDYKRSSILFESALNKARQVQNSGNASSIQCRIEATSQQNTADDPAETSSQAMKANSKWALWAFCRPFS